MATPVQKQDALQIIIESNKSTKNDTSGTSEQPRTGVVSYRAVRDLVANDVRRAAFSVFHDALRNPLSPETKTGTSAARPTPIHQRLDEQDYQATSALPPSSFISFIDSSFALGRWSASRFRRILNELLEPSISHVPAEPLGTYAETLNICLKAQTAADGGEVDTHADELVWERYAIGVLQVEEHTSLELDPNSLRDDAVMHFTQSIESELAGLSNEALVSFFRYMTKFEMAYVMLHTISELLKSKLGQARLREEVCIFLILSVIQPAHDGTLLVEIGLSHFKDHVSSDAINSCLEYCSHLQRSDCQQIILDSCKEGILVEGVCAALLPIATLGADQSLSLMEIFIFDFLQESDAEPSDTLASVAKTAYERRFSKAAQMRRLSSSQVNDVVTSKKSVFLALSTYSFIILAAAAGRANPSTVTELINFFEDTCKEHIADYVPTTNHDEIVRSIFNYAGELNFTGIIWALIEANWVPASIETCFSKAIQLGHQNMVHLLLESLLLPDSQIIPMSGVLPIIFRRNEAVGLLPIAATRFPAEVAWFLEQLSCFPIPAALPPSRNHDPIVRSRPIRGLKFGAMGMSTAIQSSSNSTLWSRVHMGSQLGRGSGSDDLETESTICMCPEALLTADAFHASVGKRYFKANSFIRLLATGDESIILQPVMRAMMEYHWVKGYFWLRFIIQLIFTLSHIGFSAYFFIQVVNYNLSPGTSEYNSIFYSSWVVLFGSLFFLFQEFREFLDTPDRYISSMSNAVDIGIHLVTIIIVLQSVWLQQSVPPLLMSIVLVLYATRVMLHLRIIPSVGPLVRIWVSASVNILPILIPMAVVITSFAGGFYIVERGLSNTGIPPSVHFSDAATTFQSVMTMASWDYSVLENSSNPQVFTLRMMFHVVFIIFLINVIIALMTVNVADIHANTTAAWLMEISDLMVELDLLWPFPVRYELRSESDRYMDEKLESQSRRPSEVSNFVFNSNSKPTFLGRLLELWAKVSGSLRKSHELMAKDDPQTKSVLLYTWPAEEVRKTQWWEADIADGDRKRQKSNSTQPAGGAGPNWTSTIASVLGVQDRQQARTLPGGGRASIVKLGEKSALPRCDEDEEASEAINLGFITNEELATSSESLRAPLLHNAKSTNFSRTGTVDSAPTNQGSGFPAAPVVPAVTFGTTQPPPQRMGRRMSRAALDPGIIDERHISIMSSMTNQNDFRELDANVDKLKKEFGSQLSDIKSLISELDKQFKSEARTQKENVKIMNELLEFERKDRGMALSKIEEDVQKMTSIILSAKEDEVNSGKLFKVFGKRGSTKTPADSTGYPS